MFISCSVFEIEGSTKCFVLFFKAMHTIMSPELPPRCGDESLARDVSSCQNAVKASGQSSEPYHVDYSCAPAPCTWPLTCVRK